MIVDAGYEKHAFKMHLNPGMAAEYKRRHDEIFPELVDLLHEAGAWPRAISVQIAQKEQDEDDRQWNANQPEKTAFQHRKHLQLRRG